METEVRKKITVITIGVCMDESNWKHSSHMQARRGGEEAGSTLPQHPSPKGPQRQSNEGPYDSYVSAEYMYRLF